MENKILLLTAALFLISCESNTNTTAIIQDRDVNEFKVVNNDTEISADSIFSHFEIIRLETANDIYMAGINKVMPLNDNYLILDKKFSNLLFFSKNGEFVRRLGRLGRGPGEYQEVVDFDIDYKNKEILVQSLSDMKIFVFDYDGTFKRNIPISFFSDSFEIINDTSLMFYINYNVSEASGRNNVLITDRKGEIIKKYAPFPKEADASVSFSGFANKYDDEHIYYAHAYSDSINFVNVNTNHITKTLKANLGAQSWPYGFDFMKLYNNEALNKSFLRKEFLIDSHYIFGSYLHKRRVEYFIFSNKKEETITNFNTTGSLLFRLVSTPFYKDNSDFYTSALTSFRYNIYKNNFSEEYDLFHKNYPELSKRLEPLIEQEVNPVLIKFKLNPL